MTDRFAEWVLRTPTAIAVVDEQGSMTYAELDRESAALASALVSRGSGRGTRVALCLGRNREVIVALLAILRAGAAYVAGFWQNLLDGVDSITHFGSDLDPDVPATLAQDPSYVRARGILTGADEFDAAFLGINPKEAALMDPQ